MNKRERASHIAYWRRRNEALSKMVDESADEVIKRMQEAYRTAEVHINQQIASWYQKFAVENEISLQQAKKLLDEGELKDFQMTLKEYIEHGENLDVDPSWLNAMINASAKHHITRLDTLKMITQAELEEAIAKIGDGWLSEMAKEAYLRSLYDLQMDLRVAFNAPNMEKVIRTAKKPWTPDGIEFAKRKGVNNAKLVQELQKELTQAAITGEKYETIADRVSKAINLTAYESMRIIRTESTHIETEARMQAYRDCGIARYQNLATLDTITCETCQSFDLTVWKVSDRIDGMNAPPFHPNCRCTTIPYFENGELAGTRAARNAEGKTVFVDGNMTYQEWLEEYGPELGDNDGL